MNQKNFNIMSRYLEWKKETKLETVIIMLSGIAIFLSLVLAGYTQVSSFIFGFAIISFLFNFFVFLHNWDEVSKQYYRKFNDYEDKQIKFFKKNGFLK